MYVRLIALLVVLMLAACSHDASDPAKLSTAGVMKLTQRIYGSSDHRGRAVSFEGIATIIDPIEEYVIVQDGGVAIRANLVEALPPSYLGHRLLLQARVSNDKRPGTVIDASAKDLGDASPPPAVPLPLTGSYAAVSGNLLVSVRGIATGSYIDVSSRLILKFCPILPSGLRGKTVQMLVLDDTGQSAQDLIDAEIAATAVFSKSNDVDGAFTGYSLVVARASWLRVLKPPAEIDALPVQKVALVRSRPLAFPLHRVRVQGELTPSPSGAGAELRDDTGTILVKPAAGLDVSTLHVIDAVGFVAAVHGQTILEEVRPVEAPTSDLRTPAQTKRLTSAAAVRRLSPEEANWGRPVELDGVLTYFAPRQSRAFIQDATAGIFVSLHGVAQKYLRPGEPIAAGARVRLRGITNDGNFAPIIIDPHLQFLGKAVDPKPLDLSHEQIFLGAADSQWVQLEGIVQKIDEDSLGSTVLLSWGQHRFNVNLPAGAKAPESLLNKHVRVRGVCGAVFNNRRQLMGIQMFVASPDQFTDLDAGTAPEPLPLTRISQVLSFHQEAMQGHTVHVQGVVTLQHPGGPTWVEDRSGAIQVADHNDVPLLLGDIVNVYGFVSPGAFSPVMYSARIVKVAAGVPLRPARVSAEDLLAGDYDSRLVEVDGRLVNQYHTNNEQVLQLDSGNVSFTVRSRRELPPAENGAVLRITGICSLTSRLVNGFAVPDALEIVTGSGANVSILRAAPWFTRERVIRLSEIALLFPAAILAWVYILRRRVQLQTALISNKLREVELLKEAAEAANRAKTDFLANISHEIRTPMNGILGLTELTLDSNLEADQRENLTLVKSSAESLLSIINDVLDFSKMEAGKLDLKPEEFDLRDLAARITRDLESRAHDKGISLTTRFSPDVPQVVVGDPSRLGQVLINLLTNAIKFTERGEVRLEVTTVPGFDQQLTLQFVVADTGIGIPLSKQESIFSAFVQADNSMTRQYGGAGLGLSISSRLVNLMGGRIWVESSEGAGSRFYFTGRFRTQPAAKRIASVPEPAVAPLWKEGASDTQPRVLVADSDPIHRQILKAMFEAEGLDIQLASTGPQAVAAIKQEAFALILMDVHLPDLDGLAATREIRLLEEQLGRRHYIAALTDKAGVDRRQECLKAGMDDCLSKPVQVTTLRKLVKRISVYTSRVSAPLAKA